MNSSHKSNPISTLIRKAKRKLHLDVPDASAASSTAITSCGYVIGEEIGSGTYAVVKRAYSQSLQKTVAIKIITKQTAPKRFLEHFLPREIHTIKRLRHPNILQYYQCIESNHRFYITMEYAANGNVLELLTRKHVFSENLAKKFFAELIGAVKYCHRYDIVHRDLKLENLMLTENYTIKLGDFGFCRQMERRDATAMLSQTFCGSHAYASPELLSFSEYDPKWSDIWACGVILYTMVMGCFPFDDRDMKQLVQQVNAQVTFWSTPVLSADCMDLIRKILAPIERRAGLREIERHPWLMTVPSETANVLSEVQ